MNKSHRQALDNSDTATPLLWQTSASLAIFLSLSLLFFWLLFSLTVPPSTCSIICYIPGSVWLPDAAHFITRLSDFKVKLHTCTDWALPVRAEKHRSFLFGFQCVMGLTTVDSLPRGAWLSAFRLFGEPPLAQQSCQNGKLLGWKKKIWNGFMNRLTVYLM